MILKILLAKQETYLGDSAYLPGRYQKVNEMTKTELKEK